MKYIAVVIVIVAHVRAIGAVEGHNVPIEGLDCRHPRSVRTGSLSKICGSDNKAASEDVSALIIMFSTRHTVKAYRCSRVESTFREICGVWSHSKLYEPPSIMEDKMISQSDCRRMALHATYVREDKVPMPIQLNTRTQYQFVRHGHLAYNTDNVACTGTTVMIHGEEVSSLLELVSVQLLVKEVDLEVDLDSAIDLDKRIKLPSICAKEDTCQVGMEAYVMDHPRYNCPLSVIRQHTYSQVPITQDGKDFTALVSDETKTLLTLGDKEYAPVGCRPSFTYRATEYADIKVVTSDLAIADLSNLQKHLEAGNLDLELELKITASYMAYHLDRMMNEQLNTVGRKLCHMAQHTIESTELSPFHTNSLIRVRGDLVQELSCTPVVAQARVGESRDGKCYADSLPAWISNQPIRIQAGTHLILQQDEVEQVNCNSTYPPIFVAADKTTLLSASPMVRVENITLQHLEEDYLHLEQSGPVRHENFGSDFFYTHEEISQFNDLIHFSRIKKRVVNNLVEDYCANNPACGAYQPGMEPASPFNLAAIRDEVTNPFTWISKWFEYLSKAGSVCSILVVIAFVCSFLWRVYQTFVLTCRHDFGFLAAVRANLLPGSYRGHAVPSEEVSKAHNQPPYYASAPNITSHELMPLRRPSLGPEPGTQPVPAIGPVQTVPAIGYSGRR